MNKYWIKSLNKEAYECTKGEYVTTFKLRVLLKLNVEDRFHVTIGHDDYQWARFSIPKLPLLPVLYT